MSDKLLANYQDSRKDIPKLKLKHDDDTDMLCDVDVSSLGKHVEVQSMTRIRKCMNSIRRKVCPKWKAGLDDVSRSLEHYSDWKQEGE